MAMAFGIHSGGIMSNHPSIKKVNQISCSNPVLPISNHKIPQNHLSVSSSSSPPSDKVVIPDSLSTNKRDVQISANIDSWMQNSVPDIVKNLKQAPLLVQIYSEDGRMKIEMEKALLEEWPFLRNQWGNGESRTKSPDGLIFVEELKDVKDSEEIVDQDDCEMGVAKAWGIVVQEKGVECGSSCYLLKTNRVCGGLGLGCCTHFCLMRVNNFRDTALEQFRDSWLLQ